MSRSLNRGISALLTGAACAAAMLGLLVRAGAADTPPTRISFQIATGSTAGTFFSVGEAIAGLVSHPPGVDRCERASVCGPPGLIASARTSPGAVDNLAAVNNGQSDSGLAQGDVIAAAVQGKDVFRRAGPQSHVRVIAALFSEQMHLVVAAKSSIRSVADLKGKRVFLGRDGSGVGFTAREVLAAYRISQQRFKPVQDDGIAAGQLLRTGKIDAFFEIGGIPLESVGELLSSGVGRLVPIDGAGRDKLLKTVPALSASVIAAGSYGNKAVIPTISTRALWIVRDTVPDALVYGMTRALFNPANHEMLAASHPSAREIGLATAAVDLSAPLHPGAARFYLEASHSAQR